MTDTQYYSLLTNSGHQANIKAKALGLPIVISKVAFGSGNITPTESATALVKEEIRANINSITQNETDKNILEIEAVIPSDVGGFLVNEAALYLEDGTLYAVANLPASYKPSLDQGAGKEFAFTIFLASVGVENVTLKIDDSIVFATRKYVQNELKKYASKNGNKTEKFEVKDAANPSEAVNKKQLDALATVVSKSDLFPKGLISMWSGAIANIPTGWLLCDGKNGTPNLTDKFIVGAGSSYIIGATGGSKDAIVVSHTHTQDSHTHTATATTTGNHTHTITVASNGAHSHSGSLPIGTNSGGDNTMPLRGHTVVGYQNFNTNNSGAHTHSATASTTGAHSHAITNNSVSPTIESTGSSGVNANLPPYYALAFIIKI